MKKLYDYLDTIPIEGKLMASLRKKAKKFPLDPDQVDALMHILIAHVDPTHEVQRVQILPADTGYGKTRIAMYLAWIYEHVFDMQILTICPANLRVDWIANLKAIGVKPLKVLSYQELRGTVGRQVKTRQPDGSVVVEQAPGKISAHKYLTRENGKMGPFYATDLWREICSNRVAIIFDESSAIKNDDSAQHCAAVELIKTAVCGEDYDCFVMHLTAAMIDKPKNWASLFRAVGLINQRTLYHQNPYLNVLEWEQYGVGEVRDIGLTIDAVATKRIFQNYPVSAKQLPVILDKLWERVFRPHMVCPVTDPVYANPETGVPYVRLRQNKFVVLDDEGVAMANEAIYMMRSAGILDEAGGVNVDRANSNFGLIQKALMLLCRAKVKTLIRLCIEDLSAKRLDGHECKLILCVPFKEDQQIIREGLELFGVEVLNGEVPIGHPRNKIIDKFNEANSECRVLIMTPEVGGIGVNLHDTDGRFPRIMNVLSTFNFLAMFQATGRSWRRGLRSNVEVNIIYGKNSAYESILVNAMVKSKTGMNVMMPGSNRVFPGSYDICIEDEKPTDAHLRDLLTRLRNASLEQLQDKTY
ncbi:MAG: hypothetical protein ACMG6E_01700 [Candidatus Roizmanbacteria bacterium]